MPHNLTISAVASRYGTSRHTVYRWLREGLDFPKPINLPSGPLRWCPADLDAWDARKRDAASAA